MKNIKAHWESIYANKQDNEVSWFQEIPETSLSLIEKYRNTFKDCSVIDVGGGNSSLVSELVLKGYRYICVLDISAKALERSRERIKEAPVKWIEGNILEYDNLDQIDIWHDRAVFHFLTDKKDIEKYVRIASEAIIKGGYLILGTFSENGPKKCSGLEISQYSKEKFIKLFGNDFELIESFEEVHTTPFDTKQNFIWGVFRKK